MRARIYKPVAMLGIAVRMAFGAPVFAQDSSATANLSASSSDGTVTLRTKVKTRNLAAFATRFAQNVANTATNLSLRVAAKAEDAGPQIADAVTNLVSGSNMDISVSTNNDSSGNDNMADQPDGGRYQKTKTYSKSYPVDGNDRIKLINQYGKIMVNTWDQHQIKVDVVIKADAEDEGSAQKLLDGVHIQDGKDGDEITYRTEIEKLGGGWKFWDLGNNKKHKVEIDYTVYMPSRNDLNVEDSYGAIELPSLSGKIKISSSYGSVNAENLSNTDNDIEGSYGSLHAASLGGAKIDFSYGSVDIDACGRLKADLSYGSFKLGKLNASGEFDISYVGGFKIEQLAGSVKQLKVDASYSSVAVGVSSSNNQSFDITTTYGGFDYGDNKVTVTSKNPPDGSKHVGPTRNFKGHLGRDGNDGSIDIHTSYGGVNFD